MQTYKTIVGVIELRMQKDGCSNTQKRYVIGYGAVTLIMKRFKELWQTLKLCLRRRSKRLSIHPQTRSLGKCFRIPIFLLLL